VTGPIERVVVPLDAASENRTAIDTAARLARRWHARLHGVFVEDEDLLRLAALPFARQVSLGGGVETLTASEARAQLHAFAEAARRELAAVADRYGVAWSFEIRAHIRELEELCAASSDFLVAGTATRPVGTHFQIECRWWQTVEAVGVSCLIARRSWGDGGAVVAIIDDRHDAARRVLDAAAACAAAGSGIVTVVCPAALAREAGFAAWLAESLAPYGARAQVEVAPDDVEGLVQRCAELDCRVLVVELAAVQQRIGRVRELVDRTAGDVLVIR
jgi:hypothetical protein